MNGQLRVRPYTGMLGQLLRLVQGRLLVAGPLGGQKIQHIPPHGVNGSGGEDQTGCQIYNHVQTPVGGAAGFGQA